MLSQWRSNKGVIDSLHDDTFFKEFKIIPSQKY